MTRSAGPGCAAPPRSPGCWPVGCARRAGWPGSSCRSASGSARRGRWARCARSRRSPPAELGELAEADREARRAYRDFAAASRRLGAGLRAGRTRGGGPRAGRAGARADLLTDALRYGERDRPPAADRHGRHAARLRGAGPWRLRPPPSGTPGRCWPPSSRTIRWRRPRSAPRVLLAMARLGGGRLGDRGGAARPGRRADVRAPSLLFSRRQALARYASALLAAGAARARRWTGPGGR